MAQTRGMYLISMVANTLDMHPQTLRKYERAGFVEPLRMGTLRTYSDEDVARLRLIKHFVEGLGLNLAGVQMALSFTGKLLYMRTGLAGNGSDSSPSEKEAISQIDEMLATLGVRVVRQPASAAMGNPQAGSPPGEWFGARPGESLEFSAPDKDSDRVVSS